MPFTWNRLAYAAIVLLIVIGFARWAFSYLARFRGWESPWKRLLAISPIMLAILFMLSGFFMVLTK